jgi:hypothetical protein
MSMRLMTSARSHVAATRGGRVFASSRLRIAWIRFPLHMQQSMLLRFTSPSTTPFKLLALRNCSLPAPLSCVALASLRHSLSRHLWSTRDVRDSVAMAPKQATLGYVESSQTLACGEIDDRVHTA